MAAQNAESRPTGQAPGVRFIAVADIDDPTSAPLDSVCSLVDGLSRLKVDKPGQPLGICFEVLGGDDSPPVMLDPVDGAAEA